MTEFTQLEPPVFRLLRTERARSERHWFSYVLPEGTPNEAANIKAVHKMVLAWAIEHYEHEHTGAIAFLIGNSRIAVIARDSHVATLFRLTFT